MGFLFCSPCIKMSFTLSPFTAVPTNLHRDQILLSHVDMQGRVSWHLEIWIGTQRHLWHNLLSLPLSYWECLCPVQWHSSLVIILLACMERFLRLFHTDVHWSEDLPSLQGSKANGNESLLTITTTEQTVPQVSLVQLITIKFKWSPFLLSFKLVCGWTNLA